MRTKTCQGILLTVRGEDLCDSHQLSFFGKGKDGPFEIILKNQYPVFFIERSAQIDFMSVFYSRKSVFLKSFEGVDIDALYFNTQKDFLQAGNEIKQRGVKSFESDILLFQRFLMERFIKGRIAFSGGVCRKEQGINTFIDPKITRSDYTPILSSLSLSICKTKGGELYSISYHFVKDINNFESSYKYQKTYTLDKETEPFLDDKSCYLSFENDLHRLDPDIIIGWGIINTSLKFLESRCQRWGIPFCLGRKETVTRIYKINDIYDVQIWGRVILDGLKILKHRFSKLDYSDSLLDSEKITEIFQEKGLIDLALKRSLITGLSIDQFHLTNQAFDNLFLSRLHRKGFVAPCKGHSMLGTRASGGYVVMPTPGMHKNVAVLDFKSLYPSILRTFCIDPYSRIKSSTDSLQTPVGIPFSKTEHILPQYIKEMMEKREIAKSNKDVLLANEIKLLMNSLIGVMGSTVSRFYHSDLPKAIMGTGQWILRQMISFFESHSYRVIYGDTDSIFIVLKGVGQDSLFDEAHSLSEEGTFYIEKILREKFQVKSYLDLEYDKVFKKIFIPSLRGGVLGAKKKYVGLFANKNGNEELYFSGMEYVRNDWTDLAKIVQKKTYELFFKGKEIESFIRESVDDLKRGRYDDKIIYRKNLTKPREDYQNHIPPHVRAAKLLQEDFFISKKKVQYVITKRGPIPVELSPQDIDYQHYIDKQIKSVTEAPLKALGKSFCGLIEGDQLELF